MEIYADVIFFVNFIFSYVLLYILGKFVNTVKIKKLRLAVAAVIGGISSAIIFCIEMPMWISYVLRCVAMFLMITTAYFEKRKNILNQMLWFVMLGGIMMFVMIMLVCLRVKQSVWQSTTALYILILIQRCLPYRLEYRAL